MSKSQNLTQKSEELQVQLDLLHNKIMDLRRALAIEADAAMKFKLKTQIEEAKSERDLLEQELQELEQQLPDPMMHNPHSEQQKQEHLLSKKPAFSSGVQIGNVSGGITNSIITGGDVSDVTITVRKDKKRKTTRQE